MCHIEILESSVPRGFSAQASASHGRATSTNNHWQALHIKQIGCLLFPIVKRFHLVSIWLYFNLFKIEKDTKSLTSEKVLRTNFGNVADRFCSLVRHFAAPRCACAKLGCAIKFLKHILRCKAGWPTQPATTEVSKQHQRFCKRIVTEVKTSQSNMAETPNGSEEMNCNPRHISESPPEHDDASIPDLWNIRSNITLHKNIQNMTFRNWSVVVVVVVVLELTFDIFRLVQMDVGPLMTFHRHQWLQSPGLSVKEWRNEHIEHIELNTTSEQLSRSVLGGCEVPNNKKCQEHGVRSCNAKFLMHFPETSKCVSFCGKKSRPAYVSNNLSALIWPLPWYL